jgi:hypothetical protein
MYPGPNDLSIDKVEEDKGETWQKSLKSFKCEYDCEHVVTDLARELAETKIKLAIIMIANATISGKGSFTKSTNSVW